MENEDTILNFDMEFESLAPEMIGLGFSTLPHSDSDRLPAFLNRIQTGSNNTNFQEENLNNLDGPLMNWGYSNQKQVQSNYAIFVQNQSFQTPTNEISPIQNQVDYLIARENELTPEDGRAMCLNLLNKFNLIEQQPYSNESYDGFHSSLSTFDSIENQVFKGKQKNTKQKKNGTKEAHKLQPSAIAERVIQSSLDYLIRDSQSRCDKRLGYIDSTLEINLFKVSAEEEKYRKFLKSLVFKNDWTDMKECFRKQNKFYVNVLLVCIGDFLSEDGEFDFNDWVEKTQLGFEPGQSDKEWIKKRFHQEFREFKKAK